MVNVLLDEIHVKKFLSYKGGKIYDGALNSDKAAATMQAFMILSLVKKHNMLSFVSSQQSDSRHTFGFDT